jgi:hypothetical protein
MNIEIKTKCKNFGEFTKVLSDIQHEVFHKILIEKKEFIGLEFSKIEDDCVYSVKIKE